MKHKSSPTPTTTTIITRTQIQYNCNTNKSKRNVANNSNVTTLFWLTNNNKNKQLATISDNNSLLCSFCCYCRCYCSVNNVLLPYCCCCCCRELVAVLTIWDWMRVTYLSLIWYNNRPQATATKDNNKTNNNKKITLSGWRSRSWTGFGPKLSDLATNTDAPSHL